jgi:hypothetical protein
MTRKELNKIRLEILGDKSITGISFDPKNVFDPEPKIILHRGTRRILLPEEFKSWDKLK